MRVRLSSDLKSGQVKLTTNPIDLQDGGFGNDRIELSDHKFSLLQSGKESLTFSFRAEPADQTLTSPVSARDVNAVIIANLASQPGSASDPR
jgi:hypothetical protein